MKPQLFMQVMPIAHDLAAPHTDRTFIGIADVTTGEIIAWCKTLGRALLLIDALERLGVVVDVLDNRGKVARQAEWLRQQGVMDTESGGEEG